MAPNLAQVLMTGGNSPQINITYLLAGLATFFMATLSAYRGYKVFRSGRLVGAMKPTAEAPSMVQEQKNEEVEKLSFKADELKFEKCQLEMKNDELQKQVRNLCSMLEGLKKSKEALEQSLHNLTRECEKLKSDKAEFLAKKRPAVKLIKSKVKVVKALKIIKKGGRKPTRVSKKKK
ncbi:MAG: hypothetical protein ABIH50_00055 [bacterium]